MDILNSTWLVRMLEKSSPTPHGRLLSLFDILEDWLDAPHIGEHVSTQGLTKTNSKLLQDFLAVEAAKAGATMPEILANQLYFMAISTIQARLQSNIHAGSGHAFHHAKNAANALILAQTKKDFHIANSSAYAIAASFIAVLVVAGVLFMLNFSHASKAPQIAGLQPLTHSILTTSELTTNPEQTVALMAQLEQMRHGNCQLIEAIQLPDNVKGIYLNMVVNGQVSTDPHEQQIAMELLKKTRCNYTPMLMANSTG
jgi:hypothetical protein